MSEPVYRDDIKVEFDSKEELPTLGGVEGVVGHIPTYNAEDRYANSIIAVGKSKDIEEVERGITIEASSNDNLNVAEAINEYCHPESVEIVAPEAWNEHLASHMEKPVNEEDKILTKKEMSLAFMMQKDNIKIDLKKDLNTILKDYPDRVDFIRNLFNTKVSFKQYKHLNFATKRIVLNNILRGKLLEYSASLNIPVNDILVLLENDTHHSTYLHNLKVALSEIISKGIKIA